MSSSHMQNETPRKFGKNLTHSAIGNDNSMINGNVTGKKKGQKNYRVPSPQFDMTTPKEIRSRFRSKRENTVQTEASMIRPTNNFESLLSPENNVIKGHEKDEKIDFSDIVGAPPTFSKSPTNLSKMRATEYTVSFQPGTIGLKLEPVIKNNEGKEFGCRVMNFVDLP